MADEVREGFPRQDSVSRRDATFRFEHAAAETCTLMNFLGYGPHIRQARRDAYTSFDRLETARGIATWITTGSKAEGLTSYLESDRDFICVQEGVTCLEDGVDSGAIPWKTSILRCLGQLSYPGHCRLLLERYGIMMTYEVINALCDDGNGRMLLSSDIYINEWLEAKVLESAVAHGRAGPSTPCTIDDVLHYDFVYALPLHCPIILTRWAARPRNWPTPNIVQEVVSLGAVVTPVGFKGSAYENFEWRICFNTGENLLVNNLNDTQVKLYALLKMVKTDVLKPRKKEITSFTMKNIVLWLAENNPQSLFHDRSLFYWLHEGLDALRVAIDTRKLPYYMIPERNLMAACDLEYEQRSTWIATINEMTNEGPRIILRLPKIRQALIAHPEPLRWYSRRKIEMEMLQLIDMNRISLGVDEETDVIIQTTSRRKREIGMEVYSRMNMEGYRDNDMLHILNSLLT